MASLRRIIWLMVAPLLAAPAVEARPATWSASWAASPAPPLAAAPGLPPGSVARAFDNQTIVQTVRLSRGGSGLRLRLTNEYGEKPLRIGAVRLRLVDDAGSPVDGTQRVVTFAGRAGALIPASAPWLSDRVALAVPARARLEIAMFLPEATGLCTCHAIGGATARISPPGDFTDRPFTAVDSVSARAFIAAVDVETSGRPAVVVTFGDSITDGYRSSIDRDRRWPDRLAKRLATDRRHAGIAVANAGLSGNRILLDGSIALFGQSAVERLDRDVLSMPGASTVIVLLGINDIGQKRDTPVTVDAMIGGYRQIIERAHGKGIRVLGGTMLPYEGAAYYRPEGEAIRQTVNRWILSSGAFDGTIDFDGIMRDPAHPSRLRPALQSGDWLHPNDEGYRVMGDAVPLALLR